MVSEFDVVCMCSLCCGRIEATDTARGASDQVVHWRWHKRRNQENTPCCVVGYPVNKACATCAIDDV